MAGINYYDKDLRIVHTINSGINHGLEELIRIDAQDPKEMDLFLEVTTLDKRATIFKAEIKLVPGKFPEVNKLEEHTTHYIEENLKNMRCSMDTVITIPMKEAADD